MKTPSRNAYACMTLVTVLFAAVVPCGYASPGNWNPPPGEPGPTMHDLDEIFNKAEAGRAEAQQAKEAAEEGFNILVLVQQAITNVLAIVTNVEVAADPRIPVTNDGDGDVDLDAGTYYLVEDITDRIDIAGDVTLDLMGFTVSGGIDVVAAGVKVHIRNGIIRGAPGHGISANNAWCSLYENLILADNGDRGLSAGKNSVIRSCTACDNGGAGFAASGASCTFVDCTAYGNGANGFALGNVGNVARGCIARENAGSGFSISTGGVLENCVARDNLAYGFGTSSGGASLRWCSATMNTLDGFLLGPNVTLDGCKSIDHTAQFSSGFNVTASGCTIMNSDATGNDFGLRATADGARATLVGCTVSGNGSGISSLRANSAVEGWALSDCRIENNQGVGLLIENGTVRGCTINGNFSEGVIIYGRCILTESRIERNGAVGGVLTAGVRGAVSLDGSPARGRIEGNHLADNVHLGLLVESVGNFVVNNRASNNGIAGADNYNIVAGNTVGDILDFSAGGLLTSNNPWANFIH